MVTRRSGGDYEAADSAEVTEDGHQESWPYEAMWTEEQ